MINQISLFKTPEGYHDRVGHHRGHEERSRRENHQDLHGRAEHHRHERTWGTAVGECDAPQP